MTLDNKLAAPKLVFNIVKVSLALRFDTPAKIVLHKYSAEVKAITVMQLGVMASVLIQLLRKAGRLPSRCLVPNASCRQA